MTKTIDITLDEDEALVLFNYLTERIDPFDDKRKEFDFSNPDFAETVALCNLLATFEPKIDVVFNENYRELLDAAKKAITEGHSPESFS